MTDSAEPLSIVRFGAMPGERLEVLQRALARARHTGATAEMTPTGSADRVLSESDVIVSLSWPPTADSPMAALAAMAARKPVIVLDTGLTADWPALDPQTWRVRGFSDGAPIVVSIDPRDEEHSLVLAIRRLSNDAALRKSLADAAYAWTASHS